MENQCQTNENNDCIRIFLVVGKSKKYQRGEEIQLTLSLYAIPQSLDHHATMGYVVGPVLDGCFGQDGCCSTEFPV